MHNPNLFVITGGPGAGKTTLLRELEQRGFSCVPEVAREIIRQQVASGGDALPWANTRRYTELMLQGSIEVYDANKSASLDPPPTWLTPCVFVTRASSACKRPRRSKRLVRIIDTTRPSSLPAPPWLEIYSTDNVRKQTWAEAVRTHDVMVEAYRSCGYELVELPRVSAEERAEFVMARMKSTWAAGSAGSRVTSREPYATNPIDDSQIANPTSLTAAYPEW